MESRKRYRFRPTRRHGLPDAIAVAIVGSDATRERLAATLGDGIALVAPERADVVIHDVAGERALQAVLAEGFRTPTILLLDDPRAELARAALAAGASAVLARQSERAELVAALGAVVAGLIVIDSAAREAIARPVGPAPTLVEPLTQREREVLDMLAAGLSNRRIAERLAISENTVKAHVAAVLAKLGAESRTEAVTVALRLGLLYL